MRLFLIFAAALLMSIQGISSASVKVSNPKAIMSGSVIIKPNRRSEFSARLSPDGKYILFPQQIDAANDTYRFFLQNIKTADEIEIPVDLLSSYETVFTRFNFFSPKGDKLALFSIDKSQSPRVTEVVIFDIPSKKLTKTGITGNSAMAQFDSTGERLVVSIDNSRVYLASLKDFTLGAQISSGWVHSCSPYSPYTAIYLPPENQVRFKLMNLDTKVTFDLPVHNRNSGLDDRTSQWSSDGSYMFYMDMKDDSSGNPKVVTRVWDVKSNKEKAIIPDALCLGPGPSNNLMIMISTDNNSSDSNLRS